MGSPAPAAATLVSWLADLEPLNPADPSLQLTLTFDTQGPVPGAVGVPGLLPALQGGPTGGRLSGPTQAIEVASLRVFRTLTNGLERLFFLAEFGGATPPMLTLVGAPGAFESWPSQPPPGSSVSLTDNGFAGLCFISVLVCFPTVDGALVSASTYRVSGLSVLPQPVLFAPEPPSGWLIGVALMIARGAQIRRPSFQ